MTQPVTTASAPYALRYGTKEPMPAKQHPTHKAAAASAAKTQAAARKGR